MIEFKETSLQAAKLFHRKNHRHLKSLTGHKFSIAAIENNRTIGIVTAGRPISRILDTGLNIEITRMTTLGTKNLCSQLYSKAVKKALQMGYNIIFTYTRADETGASVRSANFKFDCNVKGRQWTGRKENEIIDKKRWSYRRKKESPNTGGRQAAAPSQKQHPNNFTCL